jgi:hypothetical protein
MYDEQTGIVERRVNFSPSMSNISTDRLYEVLYHFDQFVSHASHPIFSDPGFNFFLDFWDFLRPCEFFKSHVFYELIEMVQYATTVTCT